MMFYLSRGFVVSLNDQLHAIWAYPESLKEMQHVQLAGIIREAFDLDHTVALVTDAWHHSTLYMQQSLYRPSCQLLA